MEKVYPDFTKCNEIITTSPKWQEKVEAMQQVCDFISSHPESFTHIQEAVISYASLISNVFKATNINLLKGAYSIVKCIIVNCGAGPRACSAVIDSCVSKIHDKKLGPDMCLLLLDISEKISPNAVINSVPMWIVIHTRCAIA